MTEVTPYGDDDDEDFTADTDPRWWSPSSLLSPEASALAGFTFAVLSIVGGGIAGIVTQAVLGLSSTNAKWHLVLPAMVLFLFGVAGLALGSRVIRQGWDDAPTWAGQLARAAVVVAVPGATLSLVAIVAGLVQANPDSAIMG